MAASAACQHGALRTTTHTDEHAWAFNWHKQNFIPELDLHARANAHICHTRTLPGWTSASPAGQPILWSEVEKLVFFFLVRINISDVGQTNNMSVGDGSHSCKVRCVRARCDALLIRLKGCSGTGLVFLFCCSGLIFKLKLMIILYAGYSDYFFQLI